jgi:uncharacterized protein YcfJ
MKHTIVFATLGLVGFGAAAQEVGRVLSAVPVVQQVQVPRQVCTNQPVLVESAPSGAGSVIGAIAGGVLGNQVGSGSGRAAATIVGTLGGALLGNSIETTNSRRYQDVQQCSTQVSYENRTVAYDVTYEYAGRQFTTQMSYDPGPTVPLQVTPIAGSDRAEPPARAIAQGNVAPGPVVVAPDIQQPSAPVAVAPVMRAQPQFAAAPQVVNVAPPVVVPAPGVVYSTYPSYPAYPAYQPVYPATYPVYPAYRPYYYPPISLNLGYVYHKGGHRHGGYRHRGHRH